MEWDEIELGQVVTFQRGYDLPHRVRKPGDVPVVTSTGITDTHSEAKEKAPGVVTGRYGTIGEVFFIEVDYWPHNTTLFVKNFHDNYPLFVSYLLRTIDFQSHSDKSGVPGVNRNDLHTLRIRIPLTTDEQRAIATALCDVDTLITALDNLIAKKRHLKTATMQQLLSGKKRLPGFGKGRGYKKTEVGIIPEDWCIEELNNLCESIVDCPHSTPAWTSDGVVVIRNQNIRNGKLDLSKPSYTDEAHFLERTRRATPQENDLIITREAPKGEVCLISSGLRCCLGQRMVLLRPNQKKCSPQYLLFELQSGPIQKFIHVNGEVGSTVGNLQIPMIKSMPIPWTLPQEQHEIATVLSDMDTEITALEARCTKTQFIKQGMMQELLTGRTRLV